MIKIFLFFITFFSSFYILMGQQTYYNDLKIQFDHFQKVEKFDSALMVAKDLNELALRFETDTSLIYAVSLRYVGDCYDNLEIVDSAFIYWNKSLEILISQNRSDGLDAAECFNNLGVIYNNKGVLYYNMDEYKKAEPFYKKALEIRLKSLGEDHLDVATCLANLGALYYNMDEYKEAEPFYKKALEIRIKSLGEDHLDVATCLADLGKLYYQMDEYKEAEPFYKKALEIRIKSLGEDHLDVATCLANLGALYYNMDEYKEAEPFYKKALEIRIKSLGEDHLDVATGLVDLGDLYYSMYEYKEAEPFYKKALEIRIKSLGEDHLDVATGLVDLGDLYYSMYEYKKAEPFYKKALEIRIKSLGEDHLDVATGLVDLGDLYFSLGEIQNVEYYYKKSLEIRVKNYGEEHLDVANSLAKLGSFYFSNAEYKKAEPIYRQAMEITVNIVGEEHQDVAKLLRILSLFYEFKTRDSLLKQSLEIYKKTLGVDCQEIANVIRDLGLLYFEMGDNKTSDSLFRQSLQIYKKTLGENHPETIETLIFLGFMYIRTGNLYSLEHLFKQTLEFYKNDLNKNVLDHFSKLQNFGLLFAELGDYKIADSLLNKSLKMVKKIYGNNHPDVARNLKFLGDLNYEIDEYTIAEQFYKEAIEIMKKFNYDFDETYIHDLGFIYHNMGNYKNAEHHYLESLGIQKMKYNEFHPYIAINQNNLGNLYSDMGEFNSAEQYYKESFKIKLENINSDFSWLSANEKIAYWNQENKFFFDLGYFSYKAWKELNSSTELTYNASLVSKSLLLETSRELEQAISNSFDEVMKNQFKEMKQLLKFYNKIQSEGAANKEMALNYKRQADSLDKILVNKLGVYADSKRKFKITWKDVQSNLGSTEAAIEFVRFYKDSLYNYMALVVRPEYEYPKLVKLGDELAIQAAVQSKDYASLYNLAWKGIDSLLESVQRVYYSPSGELNNVSFSAICLQSGNDLVISSQNANRGMIIGSKITTKTDCKTVLMDKYELHQLTSTRYLADGTLQKEKKIQQSLVILGGINYDEKPEQTSKEDKEQSNEDYALMNNLNQMVNRNSTNYGKRMEYLSGTNEEVIIIENLLNNSKWKVQARSDKSAGEYEFKKEMESKSPGVLHIATHGFAFPEEIKKEGKMTELNQTSTYKIAEDPMLRCGLMLSGSNISWTGNPQRMIEQTGDDGILTAAEVANMDLSNTKLVVLSACETGLGKIEGSEGTFGLKRGFKLAGVEQLIVSLWSVPDKETMELMTLFYSDLTQSLNPVSSFEKAQKEMRLKYPTDLEKWAGFVLVR